MTVTSPAPLIAAIGIIAVIVGLMEWHYRRKTRREGQRGCSCSRCCSPLID